MSENPATSSGPTNQPPALDSRAPEGPIEERWTRHKFDMKLVNPANKRKFTVIVVGSGLAGGSAAATLGELGYNVKVFCYQDSRAPGPQHRRPGWHQRRQELPNDGDSVFRLFYDTVKGGDFRSRESNVLPTGRGQRRHHRPVRRPGCALRTRLRRAAGQSQSSAAPRSAAPSMPGGRPASSSSWVPTRPWPARSTRAR